MSHRDDTIPIDPSERRRDAAPTLDAPNFDARSEQGARAAVPLPKGGDSRWEGKLPWIVVALVAGMIGGLLGIWALTYYQGADDGAPTVSDSGAPAATTSQTPASQPARGAEAAAQPDAGRSPEQAAQGATPEPDETAGATPAGAAEEEELRGALSGWIEATNARDLDRQMSFYDARVSTFYLSRDATRAAVRAEKSAAFSRASKVDVRADAPQISLSRDGSTATMRFRKQFAIEGGGADRRGAVLQELRWRRTPRGWKIVGERDLRVVD